MSQIAQSVGAYQLLRIRLMALESDVDETTLTDTLEGLTDLHEVVAAVIRAALTDEAIVEGLKGHLHALQDRMRRISERAAAERRIARDAMVEVGLRRVTAPDFTISIRPGSPALVVVDEGAIPPAYWLPSAPRLDRQGLLADIKQGVAVAGAELSSPEPVISVRVK